MLRLLIVTALLCSTLPSRALTDDCPGDLNGDNAVTIDELITAINAALAGCPGPAGGLANGCAGDLNGDNAVTIDELVTIVSAALNGCVAPTPTPTATPPTTCPYAFSDNTLAVGVSCGYAGPFSNTPDCPGDLTALLLSDGMLVAASIGSDPIITFGAIVTSATSASLVAYFVGDDLTPQPLAGVMRLEQDGLTLVIDPDTVPAFNIGGIECGFDRYEGTFTQLVSGETSARTWRPRPPI